MLVIGIDPGAAITVYGLVLENSDGSLKMKDCGAVRTPAKTKAEYRLQTLYDGLKKILQQHKPDCAAVEKLYFQRNVTTAMYVGQARGVILLALTQANIPIFEYNPMDIKLAVTGYGMAEKMQVQQMVKVLLYLDKTPKPDDVADALAVAICHVHSAKLKSLESSHDH